MVKSEESLLNELMREYRQTVYELERECHDLNEQIDELTDLRDESRRPYQDKLTDIEAKMRLPMLERKATFSCEFGKINFRKGAVRRTWQLDALDAVCNAKPEIKDVIWMFREEKTGEPTITVKPADAGTQPSHETPL